MKIQMTKAEAEQKLSEIMREQIDMGIDVTIEMPSNALSYDKIGAIKALRDLVSNEAVMKRMDYDQLNAPYLPLVTAKNFIERIAVEFFGK